MRREFPRSVEALADVFRFADDFLTAERIDARHRYAVHFALEEIFTNMVKYNAGGPPSVGIALDRAPDRLLITMTDRAAAPFDVSRSPTQPTDRPIEDRRPGGLGLQLTRGLMDDVQYRYEGQTSHVVLVRYLRTMFDIRIAEGGRVVLAGRLDASQEKKAGSVFDGLAAPCVVDLKDLDYISSMGVGLLVRTQKRLKDTTGGGLRLVNVNRHINELFRLAGFHRIFEIDPLPT